jgi:branched-chain amino acid transport system ATP-binding protein
MLNVEDLSVSYGRIEALKRVSLNVEKGELIALIGANGSGKSTTLKAILGVKTPHQGKILFMGRDITQKSVESIVASGIALVPEGRGILQLMTVAENLELGAYHRKDDLTQDLQSIFDRFPILRERKNQMAGTLSGGEQQMLAIARAMMASPKLLMMDEPSIGLAPLIVTHLFQTIVDLKRDGYTILLAEQNVHKTLRCADRGYVFEMGNVVLEGSAQDLIRQEAVRQAYLG